MEYRHQGCLPSSLSQSLVSFPQERLATASSRDTECSEDAQAAGVPQTTNDDSYIHVPVADNTSPRDFGLATDRVIGLPLHFTSVKGPDAVVSGGRVQEICVD